MTSFVLYLRVGKDGYDVRDCGSYQSRHASILKLFRTAFEKYIDKSMLPDKHVEIKLYSTDTPFPYGATVPDTTHPNVRYMTGTKETAKSVAIPCFCFGGGWPECNMKHSADAISTEIAAAGAAPWKHNKLFWIGAPLQHENRRVFLALAQQHPDLIEAHAMAWVDGMYPTKFVSLPEHCDFRFLIDIEGIGYSARLKFLLWSRRLLFVQDRPYWDHIGSMLEPWVHYIPVARDLSDLVEKLTWAQQRENADKCDAIIANAYRFAQEHVTDDAAAKHLAKVVTDCILSNASKNAS